MTLALVGLKVKKLRLEHGWSQDRLAKLSGLSLRTIQRIEAGRSCSVESRLSLASTFDIPPNRLLAIENISTETDQFDISRLIALIIIVGVIAIVGHLSGGVIKLFDLISLLSVLTLSFALTVMSKNLQEALSALLLFRWFIFKPQVIEGLTARIRTLHKYIVHLYSSGLFLSFASLLGVLGQAQIDMHHLNLYLSVVGLPILYSIIVAELLLRPIKYKAEILLCIEPDNDRYY